jgi:hypothetical protein
MVTLVLVLTLFDCTTKVADVAPAGIETPAGSVATAVLLLKRLICNPPAGAAALSVTVPCEEDVLLTMVGDRLSDDKTTDTGGGGAVDGCTVSVENRRAPA